MSVQPARIPNQFNASCKFFIARTRTVGLCSTKVLSQMIFSFGKTTYCVERLVFDDFLWEIFPMVSSNGPWLLFHPKVIKETAFGAQKKKTRNHARTIRHRTASHTGEEEEKNRRGEQDRKGEGRGRQRRGGKAERKSEREKQRNGGGQEGYERNVGGGERGKEGEGQKIQGHTRCFA